mmetsp:Transcript_41036/g.98261  ORF Transcript_41036/g.98261 Transcript_41036/m.98261 type:complete len:840 (-) Transcript_41036:233-2752(-)
MPLHKALPVTKDLASMMDDTLTSSNTGSGTDSTANGDFDSSFVASATKLTSASGKSGRSSSKSMETSQRKKSKGKKKKSKGALLPPPPPAGAGSMNGDTEEPLLSPGRKKSKLLAEELRSRSRSRSKERQEQQLQQEATRNKSRSRSREKQDGVIRINGDDVEMGNLDHHHSDHHLDHHSHHHHSYKKKKPRSKNSHIGADNDVDGKHGDLLGSLTSMNSGGPAGARVAFDGSISQHSSIDDRMLDEEDVGESDIEEGLVVRRSSKKRSKKVHAGEEKKNKKNDTGKKKKKTKKKKKKDPDESQIESKGVKGKKHNGKKKHHDDKDEDVEGLIKATDSTRICTFRSAMLWTIFVLVVAAAVVVACYFVLWKDDEATTDTPSDNFPRVDSVPPDTVVGALPFTACNDWVPGSMISGDNCTNDFSLEHGGLLCNLVAKSMLNTTIPVDLALINAGTCLSSLQPPEVTSANIQDAIEADNIVILDIAGADLIKVLYQAAETSFGGLGGPDRYPYASGMRWEMEANLPPSERVKNIEINEGLQNEWLPIDPKRFYRVATTKFLSEGGHDYIAFGFVLEEWRREYEFKTTDTFFNFITTESLDWWNLPESEYSTQSFVAEDAPIAIATVPSRICSADIPREPKNTELCSASDVANGSAVCNLLAWAIHDQASDYDFDFVLLTADACGDDIPDDEPFGPTSAASAVNGDPRLVTMEVPGQLFRILLENSVSTALSFRSSSYPYAAGLRFSVDTLQVTGSWVSDLEILDREAGWETLDASSTLKILTTADIAYASDDAFGIILNADTSSIKNVPQDASDLLLSYAKDWQELSPPPPDKSSTQTFIA